MLKWISVILPAMLVMLIVPVGCEKSQPPLAREESFAPSAAGPDVLARGGLQYYWRRTLPLTSGEQITRGWVLDENLYFLGSTGQLYCLDAAVGNPRWSVRVARPGSKVFQPVHFPAMSLPRQLGTVKDVLHPPVTDQYDRFDAVLVNCMTHAMVLDRTTGRIYRDFPFKRFTATATVGTDGQFLFVAGGTNILYAIQLLTGAISWYVDMGEMVLAPLQVYNRRVYFGGLDGMVRCIRIDTMGENRWEIQMNGPVREDLQVDFRGIFLACEDGKFYGLNSDSGSRLWEPIPLEGVVEHPVQMAGQTAFQATRGGGLYAINFANGQVRWKKKDARKVLALIDGVVHVLDKSGNLMLVNELTGEVSRTLPLGGFDLYLANTSAPAIYVATRQGKIACIRREEAGRLRVDQLTGP
jgi:outer membrane protein assembly factor BamB